MLCPKCGATINDGAASCPACGNAVTTNQAAPASVSVPNYMVLSILTTLFCCLIGGIIAIVFSSQVNTKLAQGDIEGAKSASKKAKIFIIVNIASALLMFLLALALMVAGFHFSDYRTNSQANACISNMKQILGAGEQWMLMHDSMPTMRDLCGPDGYIKTEPTCPKDGSHYSIIRTDYGSFDVKCGSGDPRHVLSALSDSY